MKAGWKRVTVGSLLDVHYGKDHKKLGDGEIPVYGSAGVMRYAEKPLSLTPSILIPRKGTLNNVMYSTKPFWAVDTMFWCTLKNQNVVDFKFLYYWLSRVDFLSLNVGSAVPSTTVPTIQSLGIDLPLLPVQRRIAAVLGALDDKIELNRMMNANLEAQAQALFKSWFVDFTQWGGKMPKEWKMGSLLDVADYTNGLAMQKYRPKGGDLGLPVLKIKELHQGCVDDASERCQSNLPDSVVVNDGDVVFSWSGTLLVELWCGGKVGLNQHLFKVTSDKYDKWFYFMWTKHHNERFAAIAKAFATTMGHIKRGELQKAEVIIPDRETISSMTKKIKPLIDLIIQNNVESRKLAETRDALLPKLMSGEVEA